mgnify:FL=1
MRNFRNYDFWQDSKSLTIEICKAAIKFPDYEKFALSSQLRRAIVLLTSNISEGAGRESGRDFCNFLDIALGSAYEAETQIEIAYALEYFSLEQKNDFIERLQSIERRIAAFIKYIRKSAL